MTFLGETGDFPLATVELEHSGMVFSVLAGNTCQLRAVKAEKSFKDDLTSKHRDKAGSVPPAYPY